MTDPVKLADLYEEAARTIIHELKRQVPGLPWSEPMEEAAAMTLTYGIRSELRVVVGAISAAVALVEDTGGQG